MKRSFFLSTVLLLIYSHVLFAQKDSLDKLTGIYQAYIDPSVEFIIKRSGKDLILEIPGQGQANLQPDGGDAFHLNEIPVALQFKRDASGKGTGFGWRQNRPGQQAEWIKLPGESRQGITGRYRLKNDPYKLITVQADGMGFTSRVNEGPSLKLDPQEDGKYTVKTGGYTVNYNFVKEANGENLNAFTQEGGTLDFSRTQDYDALHDGGFDHLNGFTRADTLRGMLTPLRTCYDVLFYSLDVEVMPYSKSIAGNNTIRFKAMRSFDRMQVDLYANMQIEKILYHQQELSFTREYNAVFIQFPSTIQKGMTDAITIYYKGKPQIPNIAVLKGGFLWYADRDGNPWIESVCQGSGASLWWPCKDHLSDEPDSMKISITVPGHLFEISNGKLLDTVSLPGNRKRFDWYVSYPINNYNVVVNIGNYRHYSETFLRKNDSMQLHYYYLPYNLEPAKKIFSRTKDLLSFFERSFGEYPFKNDGFTLMEALYPMEHQGAVSMGSINNPFNTDKIDYNEVTRTAWHEVAHEWWGNNITEKDIADIWIHEAFATYAEAMVYEYFDGKAAAQKLLRQQVPGNKEPVIGHYDVNDFRLGDVYPKGCMMLHTLRNVIDDDQKWFDLLKGLQSRFRYQTVSTDDIVSYISKTLKKDYQPFFDQYLRHSAIPELQVKLKEAGKDLEIRYRWQTDEKEFDMPMKVMTKKDKFGFIYPAKDWKTIRVKDMKRTDFKVDTENFLVKVALE
ncbi:MAG: hypothetical protein DI535_23850 [Citrobacter freundii]|nr:MAG: hypothetical protein DI535_23850 [Citrobacter freundii]